MRPPTPIAILDANVLFPFTLRDTLLRAASEDLFQARWSDEILTETTRNLVAKGRITSAQAASLRAAMETAFPEAMVTGYGRRIPDMANDPKDRHVAAAAVHAGAALIVTNNVSDFHGLPEGVTAVTPDTFLCALFASAPVALVRVVRVQAAALRRPPRNVDDIVRGLGTVAPRFAALIGPVVSGGAGEPE